MIDFDSERVKIVPIIGQNSFFLSLALKKCVDTYRKSELCYSEEQTRVNANETVSQRGAEYDFKQVAEEISKVLSE